jgi:hypothetical protein
VKQIDPSLGAKDVYKAEERKQILERAIVDII